MAKGKRPEITLPKLDDLFSSQESREEESLSKIRDIPLEMIDDLDRDWYVQFAKNKVKELKWV